jgi:hypothetical protein
MPTAMNDITPQHISKTVKSNIAKLTAYLPLAKPYTKSKIENVINLYTSRRIGKLVLL